MYRTIEREQGLSTRFSSSRLPTPEGSSKSDQTSDAGSPRSGYSEGLIHRPHMYPPIVTKECFDQERSMEDRRDSRFCEPANTTGYQAAKPGPQSLPPLKSLLDDTMTSPPRTPMQLSPREPFLTQNTYKPPSLYPNKRSTLHASFDSTTTSNSTSDPSSPNQGYVGPHHPSLSTTSTRPPEGYYRSPDATRQRQLPPTPNGDRPLYSGSRHMPPPSPFQSRPYEYSLTQRTSSEMSSDYFGRQWPSSHSGLPSPHRQSYSDAPDPWRVRDESMRMPPAHAGFVHDPYEQRYGQSAPVGSISEAHVASVPRYDYAPSTGRARKRSNLPKEATESMKRWFEVNLNNPYPTEDDKALMARRFGISMTQVSNWFINHRRRCPELRDHRERSSRVRRDNPL